MTAPAVLQRAHDPIALGGALRRARRGVRLALHAAGAHIGRDASTVAKYERGLIDPPASVLAELAALYGVEAGEFFRPRT